MMAAAKSFAIFLTIFISFQGMMVSICAAPSTSDDAFQTFLLTFDPSKTLASRVANCVGQKDGVYADTPDTCTNTYYACYNSAAYKQTCNPTTNVWDDSVKQCVDPTQVATGSAACKKVYPAPPICNSNIPDGTYKQTGDCSALYYVCVQGQAYFSTCPNDAATNKPQYFTTAVNPPACKIQETEPKCNGPAPLPTIPPVGCETGKTVVNTGSTPQIVPYYAFGLCSPAYYSCSARDGVPTFASPACDAGKVFDISLSGVDSKDAALTPAYPSTPCILIANAPGCQTTTTSTTAPAPATSGSSTIKPFSCPASSGSYGITGATCCTNYYSCSASVATLVNCPGGYVFDSVKYNACISIMAASCQAAKTC